MPNVFPCLWFDGNGEEAMKFYTSIFKDAKVLSSGGLTGTFEINGQKLMYLNGGPMFTFNEAVSLFVECQDQEEVDYYWNALLDGGAPSRCGWLKDKYGLSWQIIPKQLGELMSDPDPKKSQAVMEAMLQMVKIDVAGLQKAHAAA